VSDAEPSKEIPRHELIAAALELGIERPEVLSHSELQQRIRDVSEGNARVSEPPPPLGRGWFNVARHLVASVIEKGLNLPTAARVLRDTVRSVPPQRPPLPTVTLAQIYMAQGHSDRAAVTLEQVLKRDPRNPKATRLMAELRAQDPESVPPPPIVTETDNVVVLHAEGGVFAYWELCRASWERYNRPEGALQLKVAIVTPDEGGAVVVNEIVAVTSPSGHSKLTSESRAVVRVAIGRADRGRWVPLIVATTFRRQGEAFAPEFTPRKGSIESEILRRAVRLVSST
jgi:hypothetical protein